MHDDYGATQDGQLEYLIVTFVWQNYDEHFLQVCLT